MIINICTYDLVVIQIEPSKCSIPTAKVKNFLAYTNPGFEKHTSACATRDDAPSLLVLVIIRVK
jgi:hypothetical protein